MQNVWALGCAPRPPKQSPYCKFLATPLCYWNGRLGFRSRSGLTKHNENWYSQPPCVTFSITVCNLRRLRRAGGSLTPRPNDPSLQALRHGHFGAVPHPNHCLCPPSEDCASKENNRSSGTWAYFRVCAPQNTACAPQAWVVPFQDEKHEWTPRRSLRFRAEDPLFFGLYPWICGQEARSAR